MKPKVFIGSSREGLDIANAIHTNLTRAAECTVWANGVFQIAGNTLNDILKILRECDFGIFVFSPDDLSIMRESVNQVVRDNVIFELGLFIGRLGPERCFFLIPDNATDLRLPSDLMGVNPGSYETGRRDKNWLAALNPACSQISVQMARLKSFQDIATRDAQPEAIDPTSAKAATRPRAEKKSAKTTSSASAITVQKYKNGFLIKGETKPHKEKLKELKGRWNNILGGWIISPGYIAATKEAIPNMVEIAEDTE